MNRKFICHFSYIVRTTSIQTEEGVRAQENDNERKVFVHDETLQNRRTS